jgi:pumilio homology domain family member 6
MTAKSIIAEIVSHANTLYKTAQGRRALLYTLAPRSRRHLTPTHIANLAETDEIRERTSKKDPVVRAGELRTAASEGLIEWVAKDGAVVASDPGGSLVITEIMLSADGGPPF